MTFAAEQKRGSGGGWGGGGGTRWIPWAALWREVRRGGLSSQPPPHTHAHTHPQYSLFSPSNNNIIHSHQLQHVSELSSRGKCQWPSDGWKRSAVHIGEQTHARMCASATCTCACRRARGSSSRQIINARQWSGRQNSSPPRPWGESNEAESDLFIAAKSRSAQLRA